MVVLILISTILLAIDNPLNDPKSGFSTAMTVLDYVITSSFIIEASLKIVSNGFVYCGNQSYIRNSWNIIDFLIIIISVSIHRNFEIPEL